MNYNENVSIWLIGNTGLRNPMRIQDGFRAFAESPFVGNLHGKEEIPFEKYLNEKGIIHTGEGTKTDGTYARKWRLMFARYGFIYDQYKEKNKYLQTALGKADDITPFGRMFLKADTIPAMQECFLRSLGVEQYPLPENDNRLFSPFRWILALMLKLEKRTGSSEISRIEFALWGQATDPRYDIDEVVDAILDLRERRKKSPAKKKFDREERLKRAEHYSHAAANFNDYCDMNLRYLRISGVVQRKGRGIIIVPAKHVIAEQMAKATASDVPIEKELKMLTQGAPLPTDDIVVAKQVLKELETLLKERHIVYDIADLPLDTAMEVNIARSRLEELLSQTDEINYAKEQRSQWREIADYMTLLMEGGGKKEYDEDNVIEVPKDETLAYLEWTLWRAALAIDHMVSKPYEVRGFRLDSDFMPVSAAGGGRGDLYCEFDDYMILTEVTMSTSSRQEAMEGEPVRRHVADVVSENNKPVYGLFVAVKIDTNTAETFRHGVWYSSGTKRRLNILPLSLGQFRQYFIEMFTTKNASADHFVELIDACSKKRDEMETPAWTNYIDYAVKYGIHRNSLLVSEQKPKYGEKSAMKFPYGINFGTMIKNNQRHIPGCVVGMSDDAIVLAYNQELNIPNEKVTAEEFQKGLFSVI